MTRIFLIRHAETEQSHDDAALWPLSDHGEEQVRALAQQPFWSEVKAIITSDEPKAVSTVDRIAFERNIPFFMHPGLRDLKRTPEWIEDYEARVLEVFQKPALSIGGWERAADAQSRILTALDELIAKYDPEPFAVVSHGMVLSLLLASVNNMLEQVFDVWQQLGFATVVLMER
ncbi:MAG TPA: histidine phosphatase family protein [Anaerolineae bacterium]|nr:histidine phosphatase family protein [Anaerolineae bacterium]